jgi:hypothetical protein
MRLVGMCFENEQIAQAVSDVADALSENGSVDKLLSDLQCTVQMERRKEHYESESTQNNSQDAQSIDEGISVRSKQQQPSLIEQSTLGASSVHTKINHLSAIFAHMKHSLTAV